MENPPDLLKKQKSGLDMRLITTRDPQGLANNSGTAPADAGGYRVRVVVR